MSRRVSIEELLSGTSFGTRQSVGTMEIIPILGDDNEDFAPPDLEVGTTHYGTVVLTNDSELPTIAPVGSGWVVKQSAQDHAIGGGAFLAPKQTRKIDTAACIQQSQGGTISKQKHELLILPAGLRPAALATRRESDYSKLWSAISGFNQSVGIDRSGGHLEFFLDAYKKTLDEFVAEFEVVPNMLGAIVLIGGAIVGVEKGPNVAYWAHVWKPLIRVCYGSLAIQVSKQSGDRPPKTRTAFKSRATTIGGLIKSLKQVTAEEEAVTKKLITEVGSRSLVLADSPDEKMSKYRLVAAANKYLAGQIVTANHLRNAAYISVCVH